jgi:hypothetical protein
MTRTLWSMLLVLGVAMIPSLALAAKPRPSPTATTGGPTPTPSPTPVPGGNPISVYGSWHCGSDACTWASVRDMTDFDTKNHWIIDRGDGSPSVNLVILAFVEPNKLLNQTNDAGDVNGVPIGMNAAVVNYFKSHGIRVMVSIGGITYASAWDTALTANGHQLGLNAAALASNLGVGVEIDYETSTPSAAEMQGLQDFVTAFRSVHPYDATGNDQTARLTVDLAAGDRWLITLATKATTDWLLPSNMGTPVLDYANAMVAARSDSSPSDWQEHLDGKPQYSPPIPPLAAAKFTGSLYIHGDNNNCLSYASSSMAADATFVQNAATERGTTNGMLGYMFWAAECEGTRTVCTTPPNTCQGGVGGGATSLNIPIPMPALRQQ